MSYSAVVLNEESSNQLKRFYRGLRPTWKWYGHHMTIKMGGLPESMKHLLGQPYSLVVSHIGSSDMAVAVRVDDGGLSFNDIPHVTLLVNVDDGGKPFLSNKITNWERTDVRFKISGTVEEVK